MYSETAGKQHTHRRVRRRVVVLATPPVFSRLPSQLSCDQSRSSASTHTHKHTPINGLFPGLPGWAGTTKVKPIWILLKQETVSGSGISWAVCKSAHCSRQKTTPAPHYSCFFTGRMPFLPPNQQCQSTEGYMITWLHDYLNNVHSVKSTYLISHKKDLFNPLNKKVVHVKRRWGLFCRPYG